MKTEVILDDDSLTGHASTGGLGEVAALIRFFWTGRSVFQLSCTGDKLVTSLYEKQYVDDARFLVSVLGKIPVEDSGSGKWRICGPGGRSGIAGEIWDAPSLEASMSGLLRDARVGAATDWAASHKSLLRELYVWAEACRTVRKGQRDRLFDHGDAKSLFSGGAEAKALFQSTIVGVFLFATEVSDSGRACKVPAGAGTAKAMCENYLHPLVGPSDCTPERANTAKRLGSQVRGVHIDGFRECWHTKEAGRGPHRIYVDATNISGNVSVSIGYMGQKL